MIPRIRALMFLIAIAPTATAAPGDVVLKTRVDPVDVELFIPKEARPVRGILVHAVHYTLKTNDRWATFCRGQRFAHLNTTIDLKLNSRPAKLRKALVEGLKEFAARAGRPELVHVPRAGVGHSAGGMVTKVLLADPATTLSNAINCSWVMDPEKYDDAAERVPALFALGAVPDAFKMLPAVDRNFVPAIRAKRPWALALQHHCAHDWGNAGTLFLPWMQAMVRLRYPEPVDVSQPVALKDVDFASGWRGDRSTIDGTWATVVPAAGYKGKPDDAVWLPDRAMAWIWRAWESKDAPVQLTVTPADGSKALPAFHPKKDFQMTVKPGVDLVLGIRAKEGTAVSAVRYYHGDRLLGEAAGAPGTVTWKAPKAGAYAVWVEYEIGGTKGAGNPALICIEP
jgi:hypothetical protein